MQLKDSHLPPALKKSDDEYESDGSGRYQRTPNKAEFGIDFVFKGGDREGFSYSTLLRRKLRENKTIVLVFGADELIEVTIQGRGLSRVFELIRCHRYCEVKEEASSMPEGEIESISLRTIKQD